MTINKLMKQLTMATGLVAASVMAQSPYDDGQQAIREQRWSDAAAQFEQSIEENKGNADAAMYWRAHALYKAGREKDAIKQVRRLGRQYPESPWLDDAAVLQLEQDNSSLNTAGLDEELRIYALAQLMDRDAARALPLVLDILKTSSSESVRRDAIFILGMSEEPAAQQALAKIARDTSNSYLQVEAIELLGSASSDASLELLHGLYDEASTYEVKEAIIQAYYGTDDPAPVLALLRAEKDPELQEEIIQVLGVMEATEELKALYPTLQTEETRETALEAIAMAGDTATLKEILETEQSAELRETAIEGIAMSGGEEAAEYLQTAYANATSNEEKSRILEALVVMDEDATGLALTILRTETDPELQSDAIEVLGIMDATEELAALYSNLTNNEAREAVLESMAIADDTAGVIKILEVEKDAELRETGIEALAIIGGPASAEYLLTLYPKSSEDDKSSVIEAMMIMENAQGLIGLMKQESDAELKKEMLEMLSVMDSEESADYLFELLEKKG